MVLVFPYLLPPYFALLAPYWAAWWRGEERGERRRRWIRSCACVAPTSDEICHSAHALSAAPPRLMCVVRRWAGVGRRQGGPSRRGATCGDIGSGSGTGPATGVVDGDGRGERKQREEGRRLAPATGGQRRWTRLARKREEDGEKWSVRLLDGLRYTQERIG